MKALWYPTVTFVLALCPKFSQSLPYYMLTSSQAKCFQVDVPSQTTITIAYSAPDLGLGDEPIDSKKRTTTRNMSLVIVHKTPPGARRKPPRDPSATPPTGRLKKQITERDGMVEYTTGPDEGPVEICAQSTSASKRVPSRIAIRVIDNAAELGGRKHLLQRLAMGQVIRSGAEQLTEHSSRLAEELSRLSTHINQITGSAEYMKEKEKTVHDRSLSLQKAVKFWPMFRMFVLIVAAYLQTHYILSFLKRRRIF